MKSLIAVILMFALTISVCAFAEEPTPFIGVISSVADDGFSIIVSGVEMTFSIGENTALETDRDLAVGDFAYVTGNGTAGSVVCHVISGVVQDVSGLTEEEPFFMILPDGQEDELRVNVDGENMSMIAEGAELTVYYSGIVLRSFPGQIYALHIRGQVFEGTIDAIEENSLTMTVTDGETIIVHTDEHTLVLASLEVGAHVRAAVNGCMTMSLPAQYFALEILPAASAD